MNSHTIKEKSRGGCEILIEIIPIPNDKHRTILINNISVVINDKNVKNIDNCFVVFGIYIKLIGSILNGNIFGFKSENNIISKTIPVIPTIILNISLKYLVFKYLLTYIITLFVIYLYHFLLLFSILMELCILLSILDIFSSILLLSIFTLPFSVLSQDGGGIEEVVVTAEKREQNLQDVPSSITACVTHFLLMICHKIIARPIDK